jgi:hypothetical protein
MKKSKKSRQNRLAAIFKKTRGIIMLLSGMDILGYGVILVVGFLFIWMVIDSIPPSAKRRLKMVRSKRIHISGMWIPSKRTYITGMNKPSWLMATMTAEDIASLTPAEKEIIELYLARTGDVISYYEFNKIISAQNEAEATKTKRDAQLNTCSKG